MARWSRTLLALAAAALLAAPNAFAQGGGASSTGSISGEVKDEQGGVLPGVTVVATSPAAIGAQTAITNEAGIYRFPPCLPVSTPSPTNWPDSARSGATASASPWASTPR